MKIEQYDEVILKDGRTAAIDEKFSENDFMADVGNGPCDWETVTMTREDIASVNISSQTE